MAVPCTSLRVGAGGAYLVQRVPVQADAASGGPSVRAHAEGTGKHGRRDSWGGFGHQDCAATSNLQHQYAPRRISSCDGYSIMPSRTVEDKRESRWCRPRPNPLDLPSHRGTAATLAAKRGALAGKAGGGGLRRKEVGAGQCGWLTPPTDAGRIRVDGYRPHQQAMEHKTISIRAGKITAMSLWAPSPSRLQRLCLGGASARPRNPPAGTPRRRWQRRSGCCSSRRQIER